MRAEDSPTGLRRTMMSTGATTVGRRPAQPTESGTSTVVTAEIPTVQAGPSYGVLMPDGSIWYPGSRKRLPAPLPLRIVVWALAFLVLLAAAGDFIIHSHPGWVDPLRRRVPAAGGTLRIPTAPGGNAGSSNGNAVGSSQSSGPSASTAGAETQASVAAASPQPPGLPPHTTEYQVFGAPTYEVAVKAGQLTYMDAYDLVNGQDFGAPLYIGYVQPGQTETVAASGPVDIQVDAGGTTVAVLSGSRTIGVAAPPPYVPWDYWFQAASAKS